MAGDANYATVGLLIPFDGANNATAALDRSPSPKTLTFLGNAKLTTAQSKFGGASLDCDGTASCRVQASSSADLEPGSGDFTVECFVRPTATPSVAGFIAFRPNASGYPNWSLSFRPANKVEAYFSRNNPATLPTVTTSVTALSLSAWTHIALVKQGTGIKLFIGGALDTSWTVADHPPTGLSTVTNIGSDGTYPLTGQIDDFRVSKYARYTAAFTPPTSAHPLGLGEVSGVIRDNAGALCARTVRAYRRDTGALLSSTVSDASTGAYLLAMPTLDEVNIVAYDDVSGSTENDRIIRVVPA